MTLHLIQFYSLTCLLQVGNMLPEVCDWIVKERLSEVRRTVADGQWKVVTSCLDQCPYPLFVEVRNVTVYARL